MILVHCAVYVISQGVFRGFVQIIAWLLEAVLRFYVYMNCDLSLHLYLFQLGVPYLVCDIVD